MAVPDTTTFTLQNVADEFDLGSNDGLIDCFEEATSSDFDSAYSGAKDNLLNFRNYGAISLTSYPSSGVTSRGDLVCGLSTNQTYYHTGNTSAPFTGNRVYSSSSGNSSDLLAPGFYRSGAFGVTYYKLTVTNFLGQDGYVSAHSVCL